MQRKAAIKDTQISPKNSQPCGKIKDLSVTFPHDLNAAGLLSVRRRSLFFRLRLPFVGAEVEDSLQRLWPLPLGERAPLIGRLVGGRVV